MYVERWPLRFVLYLRALVQSDAETRKEYSINTPLRQRLFWDYRLLYGSNQANPSDGIGLCLGIEVTYTVELPTIPWCSIGRGNCDIHIKLSPGLVPFLSCCLWNWAWVCDRLIRKLRRKESRLRRARHCLVIIAFNVQKPLE